MIVVLIVCLFTWLICCGSQFLVMLLLGLFADLFFCSALDCDAVCGFEFWVIVW